METKDWFKEGNNWLEKEDYSKALDCYEKWLDTNGTLNLDKVTSETILANSEKALQEDSNNVKAWLFKGIALSGLHNYQDAITCYDKAIELNPNYVTAYNYKGNTLFNLGKRSEAIGYYDKAIAIKPNYAIAYTNKGTALSNLGKHSEAITYYDKAITLKPDLAVTYNNKGTALFKLGNYQDAITCYDKAIAIKPDYTNNAHNNKKIVLQIIEERKQNKKFPKNIEKTYLSLYDVDFFNEAIKDDKVNEKHYDKIYAISLRVQKELQVKDDNHEANVAHYTTKKVAQILFFDKDNDKKPIPFRLNSVTNSNDIQEGKTLFSYLFNNQKIRPQAEQFVAFVGCFMFNHDNLNQFRLYGKDEDTEGTGISIVMKPDFFCSTDKSPIQTANKPMLQGDNKEPLFRCIYIDPETNQVVSIGHRDYHTFYKVKDILYNSENKEDCVTEITKEIEGYKKNIKIKTGKVAGYLRELKEIINKEDLEFRVVCNLLLNLRYLVKHVAFKEEQECRIIKIKTPFEADNNPPIDDNHQRFYVNYLPLNNCVSKVYFGPKASGMELFQSLLTYQKDFENVICYRSTSPLA